MADDNGMALGYALGQDSGGGNNGGMFGGDGWLGLILFAMIFGNGGWGGGFGGGGGGGGAAWLNGLATRADINEGFALNNITGGITAVQQGICDSTYALNNTVVNGVNGLQGSLCEIGHQISDCCCTTQRSIDSVKYDMATGFCNLSNVINNQTRDLIDNQNNNTRQIMDFLVNSKIEGLQAENQSLKLAASQAQQNSYLQALSDAQTAELIRRIAPTPVPSWQVPAPYPYCTNSGCGC